MIRHPYNFAQPALEIGGSGERGVSARWTSSVSREAPELLGHMSEPSGPLAEEDPTLHGIPIEVMQAVGAYDSDCAGGCG